MERMINRIRLLTICTVFLWVDGFAPIQNFSLFHKSHSIATTKGNFESTRLDVMLDGTNTWGNIAALTGAATVAQSLGKTTAVGRLLGAPVTAMTITFILASIGILNPGGTAASKFLQLLTLQLAVSSREPLGPGCYLQLLRFFRMGLQDPFLPNEKRNFKNLGIWTNED